MLEVEGLSPKPVEVPPEEGLLAFKTVGEAPEPAAVGAPPDVDAVVGVLVDGDEEEEDVAKTQEPELGFALVIIADPPKSQLVCDGFFW